MVPTLAIVTPNPQFMLFSPLLTNQTLLVVHHHLLILKLLVTRQLKTLPKILSLRSRLLLNYIVLFAGIFFIAKVFLLVLLNVQLLRKLVYIHLVVSLVILLKLLYQTFVLFASV